MRLEVVDQDGYLRQLARRREGCERGYELIKRLLEERGETPLKMNNRGRVIGLLDAAVRLGVVNQDGFLSKLARQHALVLMESEAANEKAAKFFELAGEDKALSRVECLQIVKELITRHLPEFGKCAPPPLCQVFEACGDRGKTKTSLESVDQFRRDCFKAAWDTGGESPHQSASHFEHHILYETNNPPNAFGVEKEMHGQLTALGAKHPTERLFQRIGSGGLNPEHHYDGKNYGVYLLVRRGGPPPGWRLVNAAAGGESVRSAE